MLPVQPLLDAISSMAGQTDVENLLQTFVDRAVGLSGAHAGALGVLGEDGEVLRVVTSGQEDGTAPRLDEPASGDETLVVPVQAAGVGFGLLHLTCALDHRFTSEVESFVRALSDAAGHAIGHARACAMSERRRRWLEAATDVGLLLADLGARSEALEQVARRARSAAGARAAAVVALPEDGTPAVRVYDGPEGLVTDADLVDAALGSADRGLVAARLEARLEEPVALVLALVPGDDPDLELTMLGAFADRAGLAIDRAEAVQVQQELAVVTERERIARDLHDTVIQRLFAAGLQLQVLRTAPPELVEEGVDLAVDALDEVIREIRGTVLDLRDGRQAGL